MKTNLDSFEQAIEDNAERFIPLSESEKTEVETIINTANKTRYNFNFICNLFQNSFIAFCHKTFTCFPISIIAEGGSGACITSTGL